MFEQRFDHICAEHAEAMEAIEHQVRQVVARRKRQDAASGRQRTVSRAVPPQAGFDRPDEPAPPVPESAVTDAAVPDSAAPDAAVPDVAITKAADHADADSTSTEHPPRMMPTRADPEGAVPEGEGLFGRVARCGPAAVGAALLDPRWNSHRRRSPR